MKDRITTGYLGITRDVWIKIQKNMSVIFSLFFVDFNRIIIIKLSYTDFIKLYIDYKNLIITI